MKELIFISSVQKELADERRAIRDFICGVAMFGQYFDVFLFENLSASRLQKYRLTDKGRTRMTGGGGK